MMSLICFMTLAVSPWTAYLYSEQYLCAPGVYIHGLTSLIGFGYSAFLAILFMDGKYFGGRDKVYERTAFVLTMALLAAIFAKSSLFISTFVALHIILLSVMAFSFKFGKRDGAAFFAFSAIIIAISAWIYFLYSFHFESWYIFTTKFSYSLLALSFPFSLAAFSKFYPMLAGIRHWRIFLGVLVVSVLMMFVGVMLKSAALEGFFAIILIIWIIYAVYEARRTNRFPLVVLFAGLFVTGALGVLYFYHSGEAGTEVIRSWHAHAAYMLWAIMAYYVIYFNVKKLDAMTLWSFIIPNVLSFTTLGIYLVGSRQSGYLYMSTAFFVIAVAGIVVRRLRHV